MITMLENRLIAIKYKNRNKVDANPRNIQQGHPERMVKVKPFLVVLIFTKVWSSQLFLVKNYEQFYPPEHPGPVHDNHHEASIEFHRSWPMSM